MWEICVGSLSPGTVSTYTYVITNEERFQFRYKQCVLLSHSCRSPNKNNVWNHHSNFLTLRVLIICISRSKAKDSCSLTVNYPEFTSVICIFFNEWVCFNHLFSINMSFDIFSLVNMLLFYESVFICSYSSNVLNKYAILRVNTYILSEEIKIS